MATYNNMADVAYDIARIVNQLIKRARRNLDTQEQEIIDLLTRVEERPKEYRLISISSLTAEKDRLSGNVVELVGSLCECVEKHVPPLATDQPFANQPDEIPMESIYFQGKSLSNYISMSSSLVGLLEVSLKDKPLEDPETESNSKKLIENACKLEKNSVIKENWKSLPDTEDPDGMIGCTYSQLLLYYPRIAPKFKRTFQPDADKYLDTANNILDKITEPSPNIDMCFRDASQLLFDASDLVGRASRWIASQCD